MSFSCLKTGFYDNRTFELNLWQKNRRQNFALKNDKKSTNTGIFSLKLLLNNEFAKISYVSQIVMICFVVKKSVEKCKRHWLSNAWIDKI